MKTVSIAGVQRTGFLDNLGRADTLWHLNRPLVLPFHLQKYDPLFHISRSRFLEHLEKSDPFLHLRHGNYEPKRKFDLLGRLLELDQSYLLFGIDLDQEKPPGQLALDFTHKLLAYANDAYMWDKPFKYMPLKALPLRKPIVEVITDQIAEKLSRINENDLEFVFSFPYVQSAMFHLIVSLNNNDSSYSKELIDLNENIDKALMAKSLGLYIPGTDIFVFKEGFNEVSSDELQTLTSANERLNHVGSSLQETFFMELSPIEDAFAVAWKPYGCTLLDWPLCGSVSEYEIPSGAQYLIHEDQHHGIRNEHKYGLAENPFLEVNAESPLILGCTDPDDWIEEAVAHSTDIETILKLQPKDLDWNLIIETCLSVQAVIDTLRSPEVISDISKEGLLKLALAEEKNRRNLLSTPSYSF